MNSETSGSSRQMGVLVLGAGRSGTSTLTRGLAALGVDIGRHFFRPVRKNPRGNYEEKHLLTLSKQVRNSLGMRADSVHLVDQAAWDQPGPRDLSHQMQQAVNRWFGHAPVWAFKYAGNGRLIPFWLALFERMEIEPAFVFAYRNPLSIRASREKLNRARAHPGHNQLEWLANVLPHIDRLQGRRLVVVDYDRLLEQPEHELGRVADALSIARGPEVEAGIRQFSGEFLRHDWRHTRFDDEMLRKDRNLLALVRRSALLLSAMARDNPSIEDPGLWEQWRALQAEYRELGPMLQLIEDFKRANRRARWWDLSEPLRAVWNKVPVFRLR
ncbi:MAG: sulfotransferase [Wenzhouxiangellaceae bacterium]